MRRFWLLPAAILCWLVILAVPLTRRDISATWQSYRPPSDEIPEKIKAGPFEAVDPETAAVLRRYPNDRDVLVYVANQTGLEKNLKVVADLYPKDAYVVRLQLVKAMENLKGWRVPGPLSNPNYPKAPPPVEPPTAQTRAQWDKVIALARRGMQLEPNNTFFDWLLLYALYSTNRDDETRQVLSRAARKTGFDSHQRDEMLGSLAYLKRAHGSPLSPLDLLGTRSDASAFKWLGRFRQTARDVMEIAIADRQKGEHDRAINSAINLMKLSRVLRREGYTYIDSLVGSACEHIALRSSLAPLTVSNPAIPRLPNNATLAQYRTNYRSLYLYAQQTGRKELLPILDAEWTELGQWSAATRKYTATITTDSPADEIAPIVFAQRLRALVLRVLPSILILGVLFWLLSRRVRDGLAAPSGLWRGIAFGAFLLIGATACDITMSLCEPESYPITPVEKYVSSSGLLPKAPSWVSWGLAGIMICFGVHGATRWQKQQSSGKKPFKEQLKTLFAPSEDGLAAFDFGWLFSWVARLTFWLILLYILAWLCGGVTADYQDLLWLAPAALITLSLALHAVAWRRTPHRRTALKLSHRLTAEAMAGFFVTASVVYALALLVGLPLAFQFEREFEGELRTGELKIVRAKLGL